MASHTYQGTDPGTDSQHHDDHSSVYVDSEIDVIRLENTANKIITKAPEERFRLGKWDVIALVVNRVIGRCCHGKYSPCQGVRDPLSVLIYRGFLPINLQLTRASKTAIPLRDRCSHSSLNLKLMDTHRNWYLQFSIDDYARDAKRRNYTSVLACRRYIYGCWCSFKY